MNAECISHSDVLSNMHEMLKHAHIHTKGSEIQAYPEQGPLLKHFLLIDSYLGSNRQHKQISPEATGENCLFCVH